MHQYFKSDSDSSFSTESVGFSPSIVGAGGTAWVAAIILRVMKIHQLPMGARFEFEGVEYVKCGPLVAAGPQGQRLIPKYAVLKPLDGVPPPVEKVPVSVSRVAVLAAFARFHAACAPLVPDDRQDALAAAREDFLKALD